MKNNLFKRLFSLFLVAAMVFTTPVFAQAADGAQAANATSELPTTQTSSTTVPPPSAPDSAVSAVSGASSSISASTSVASSSDVQAPPQSSSVAKPANAWVDTEGGRAYADASGTYLIAAQTIDGADYYFNDKGIMQTGWQQINDAFAYYEPTEGENKGKLQKEKLFTVDGLLYYSDATGFTVRGIKEIDGKTYSFTGDKNAAQSGSLPLENGELAEFSTEDFAMITAAPLAAGWVDLGGGKKGYVDEAGNYLTGAQNIGDGFYNFDASGVMRTGWVDLGYGMAYYEVPDGKLMVNSFYTVDGNTYYSNAGGVRVTGTQYIGGSYNFDANGVMRKGWIDIDYGYGYYDLTTGLLKIDELINVDGKLYYCGGAGNTAHGIKTVNGKTYSFTGDKNAAQSGRLPLGNGKYGTFDPISFELITGKSGWVDLGGGKKAYADEAGNYLTGTQNIGDGFYNFDASGVMRTGWVDLGYGMAYYEVSDGKLMVNSFYTVGGNTYYSNAGGVRVTGTQYIGGSYNFDANGVMRKGWIDIGYGFGYYDLTTGLLKIDELINVDGKLYYCGGAGNTAHGIKTVKGKTYSFTGDKNAAQSGRLPLGNGKYGTFDPISFELVTGKSGWVDLGGGKKGYVDEAGNYLTGTQNIGDGFYNFDASGVMRTGWVDVGYGMVYYDLSTGKLKLNELINADGKLYYATMSGTTQHGMSIVNGKTYNFIGDKNAAVAGGAMLSNGKFGYFDKNSFELVNAPYGWITVGADKYFGMADGYLAIGGNQVDGGYYYFDPANNAKMLTGWRQVGNRWACHGSDGKLKFGWFDYDGPHRSGDDGLTMIGWNEINGSKFYGIASDKGKLATGWYTINGVQYLFDQYGNYLNQTRGNKGIDVSAHQGRINWKAVADSGISFAMIRAVVWSGNAATGQYVTDPYFYDNVAGAKANGIKVGAYIFSTAFTEAEVRGEVDFFVNTTMAPLKAQGFAFDLPVFVDHEYTGITDIVPDKGVRTALLKYEMDLLSSNGYYTGMYMGRNWAINIIDGAALQNMGYDFWIADWNDNYQWSGATPAMWQYSNSGSVPGINGRVDMNYLYKDYSYIHGSSGGDINKRYSVYDENAGAVVTDTMLNLLSMIVNNEVGDGLNLSGGDRVKLWRAQAVASHSWLLYHYENQDSAPKVKLKRGGNLNSIKETISEVADKVALYNGKPINAMYGASCNGYTNSSAAFYGASEPYLVNVDSHWEREWSGSGSLKNKSYNTKRSSLEEIVGAGTVAATKPANWLSVTRDSYGYVTGVRICGQSIAVSTAYDKLWGTVSGDFNPTYLGGETWQITNNGYGHGIGMSQWGAASMIAMVDGCTWSDIIKHYFPGTSISTY